jgi:hypothetical protein
MVVIQISSIKDVVRQGKLVDLNNDYRTAVTVKGSLPERTFCAMSAEAFRQSFQQKPAEEMGARVEALCTSLKEALGRSGNPSEADFEYRFFGSDRKPQSRPLKVRWFAPNRYWVILLPDEEIQQMAGLHGTLGSAGFEQSPK